MVCNTATTSGSATGVQSQVAGPLPAIAGTIYTFTETAANAGTNLSSYAISASCVDTADGNAPVATTPVSTTSFTVNLPAAAGADGQAVVCTFDNQSAPTITSPAFGDGEVGLAYSHAAAATAGSTPYGWSVTGGSLPPGLSLDASTGALTGTPTTPGTYSFTLVVTDANGQTATQVESVVVRSSTTTTARTSPTPPAAGDPPTTRPDTSTSYDKRRMSIVKTMW